MALNADQIVKSVNDAGFADAADLTQALSLAKQVLTRNALSYQIDALKAKRVAASAATEAEIQALQAKIADIDAQLAK